MDLQNLTHTDFETLLQQIFVIRLADGQDYSLKLIEVKVLGAPAFEGARQPFSLTFSNPVTSAYLPQRTYHLQQADLGAFEIFLTALGPSAGAMLYEAVFA